MRKFLSILFVSCLVLSGCGSSDEDNDIKDDDQEEQTNQIDDTDEEKYDNTLTAEEVSKLDSVFNDLNAKVGDLELVSKERKVIEYNEGVLYEQYLIVFSSKKVGTEGEFTLTLTKDFLVRGLNYKSVNKGIFDDVYWFCQVGAGLFPIDSLTVSEDYINEKKDDTFSKDYDHIKIYVLESSGTHIISDMNVIQQEVPYEE